MKKLNVRTELHNKYKAWATEPYGELFLPPEAALQFVNDCDAVGLATIGVEAFRVIEGKLFPMTDEIADWSSARQSGYRALNAETRTFISRFIDQPDIRMSISILTDT